MELQPVASYARAVRAHLSNITFEPARSRMLWLPIHASVIAGLAWAMGTDQIPMWSWPLASIVIGLSMSATAFLGHEVMHGAIIKGRLAIRVIGWICMLPFLLTPTLWTAWHNRVHHNHTAQVGKDPDMYPTIAEYKDQAGARLMADYFGFGGRRWRSVCSLLFGFTGQSQQMLWQSRKLGILDARGQRRAIFEFVLGVAVWTAVAFLVGPLAFLFVFLLPLIIANVMVMSFILTNHSLSSLTPDINDPLVNSLSVTLPRPLEWLTLDFGFHVEHHVFPTISARYGRVVRAALIDQFGDRYQSMPMMRAMGQLYRTGRVYLDDTTLIEPRSGDTHPALRPSA
jgi:fatty acid desaturase